MTHPDEPVSLPTPSDELTLQLARQLQTEDDERRRLRRSLLTAFVAHATLLAITLPGLYSQEVAAETPDPKVFVLQQPRFKPPAPPPTQPPEKRKVRKPIPDPTPDDPEPLPVAEIEPEPEPLSLDDTYYLAIPDSPPEPEPDRPIEVGGEVKAPERVRYVEPKYTELARRARVAGLVVVETIVDRNGDVTQVKVLRGLSMGLTESAIDAVEQWKFKPATLRGKPVDVIYRLTVRFEVR